MQDLFLEFIVKFLNNIHSDEIPSVIKNQREMGLDFHLLDLKTIKELSQN